MSVVNSFITIFKVLSLGQGNVWYSVTVILKYFYAILFISTYIHSIISEEFNFNSLYQSFLWLWLEEGIYSLVYYLLDRFVGMLKK